MSSSKKLALFAWILAAGSLAATAQESAAQPEMDAEDRAAMAAWMASASVSDQHRWLADKTGDWEARMELWMDPDADPMESRASVSRTMELGGRVLLDYWSGEIAGDPFEGVGRMGYNNVTGEYWSTWTDTMSTALFESRGAAVEDADQLELTGEHVDPVTDRTVQTRYVWTFASADREILEAYERRDGKEMRVMRVTLVRSATE